MTTVAFLGLGAMGTPMARNLLKKGFPLHVWNRSAEKARALAADGAVSARGPRDAAAPADIVCTMLADPAAVGAVASGPEGLAAGLAPGKIWLDFSTVTPYASRRFAAMARAKGAGFCDVPVAGSVGPAADGTLTILAGGDPATLEAAAPVLAAVSRTVVRFGDVGQGSAMKLANNLLFGIGLTAFGEALALAKRLGIPEKEGAEWLLSVPAVAPYVKLKWDQLRSNPEAVSFSLALMEKDLRLALESAGDAGLPLLAATRAVFAEAAGAGLAKRDMSAVMGFVAGVWGEKKGLLPRDASIESCPEPAKE
jgi:3-hydroxyisobutyrate dehydrogenase-like beta-hydroxyacid dehydrogenase